MELCGVVAAVLFLEHRASSYVLTRKPRGIFHKSHSLIPNVFVCDFVALSRLVVAGGRKSCDSLGSSASTALAYQRHSDDNKSDHEPDTVALTPPHNKILSSTQQTQTTPFISLDMDTKVVINILVRRYKKANVRTDS